MISAKQGGVLSTHLFCRFATNCSVYRYIRQEIVDGSGLFVVHYLLFCSDDMHDKVSLI